MMHHTSVCTYNNKTSFSSHNCGNQTNDHNQWTGGLNNVSAAEDGYPKPVNKSLTATLPAPSWWLWPVSKPRDSCCQDPWQETIEWLCVKNSSLLTPSKRLSALSKLRSGTLAVPVSKLNNQRAVFEKLFTSCRSGTVAVHISKLNNQKAVSEKQFPSHISGMVAVRIFKLNDQRAVFEK